MIPRSELNFELKEEVDKLFKAKLDRPTLDVYSRVDHPLHTVYFDGRDRHILYHDFQATTNQLRMLDLRMHGFTDTEIGQVLGKKRTFVRDELSELRQNNTFHLQSDNYSTLQLGILADQRRLLDTSFLDSVDQLQLKEFDAAFVHYPPIFRDYSAKYSEWVPQKRRQGFIVTRPDGLIVTSRQLHILQMISQGKDYTEIASSLGVGDRTLQRELHALCLSNGVQHRNTTTLEGLAFRAYRQELTAPVVFEYVKQKAV